ncbi:MAG: sulfatase [Acidobacteria bacterium]|nr:sulfatase [Acidobacteriota bacterium]
MSLTRRGFTQALAAGSVLGAARRPNIVMIYADDLGYGDLGCYGHPTIRTPNLDRMAREGMRFTQWYSAAPVCTPSRAALLTGRYPVRSGLTRVLFPDSPGGIPTSEVTIAQTLKSAGYRTAMVGKWHLGCLPEYLPLRHGFDTYFGLPYSNDMRPLAGPGSGGNPKHPPLPLIRGDKAIETNPDQSQLTIRYTEEALKTINGPKDRPFFLYLAHTFPHVPLYASERFRGKSARGLYGDVVEELDWSTGEVLKALKQSGQDSNTLVVFSSDNGPWLPRLENGGSAGLLREGKGTTWDGGMREPCLARWPGTIPAASVSAAQGNMMDWFPTFARAAGAPLPAGVTLDGEDMTGVLTGKDQGKERVFYYWHQDDLRAVRKGPWKLHTTTNETATQPVRTTKLDKPALYNLEVDPSEKYDVSGKHPDVVRELAGLLESHLAGIRRGEPQK